MNDKLRRFAIFSSCALLLGAGLPVAVAAQSQQSTQQSVAEAARRAREKKKPEAKPGKVYTNDDLKPATPAAPAKTAAQKAEGGAPEAKAAPAAAPSAQAQAPAEQKAAAKDAEEEKKAQAAKLAELKKQLAAAQSDLDLYRRQFALQRDTYYSNPDYAHDTDGKAKLDALQQQISGTQQKVEELKTRIAALQELLGPSAEKEAPATSPQQQ